jgi:RNase P/RNase MRP subunit p29
MKYNDYQISEKRISKIRLIGRNCEIMYKGKEFTGQIQKETKNTWQIKTKNGLKTIPKNNTTLYLTLNNEKYEINGSRMKGRHEDRIKQRMKRKW